MKQKNLFTLMIILFFGIVLYSCDKEDSEELISSEDVSFGLSLKEISGRVDSDLIPAKARVTIQGPDGQIEFREGLILELFVFGEGYVSESVALVPNSYQLTLFQILDEDDKIIYASPLEGSTKAPLVAAPLPLAFEVIAGEAMTIVPEVLLVAEDDSPIDFGYVDFSFNVINNFSIDLNLLSDWDSSYLDATWTFTGFAEDSTLIDQVDVSYTKGVLEHVILSSDVKFYQVEISKKNYHSVNHYFQTDYLKNLKVLSISLSPSDLFQQFLITAESFGLNALSLYVPLDGCLAYGRIDAAGVASMDSDGFHYLYLDRMVLDLNEEPNEMLDLDVLEIYSEPNLVYLSGYNASNAPNQCDEWPDMELAFDMFLMADFVEDFVFINVVWDTLTSRWQVSSSSMKDPNPWGKASSILSTRN